MITPGNSMTGAEQGFATQLLIGITEGAFTNTGAPRILTSLFGVGPEQWCFLKAPQVSLKSRADRSRTLFPAGAQPAQTIQSPGPTRKPLQTQNLL